jgi:hypothetical protein
MKYVLAIVQLALGLRNPARLHTVERGQQAPI